jgi:hypothetical protein
MGLGSDMPTTVVYRRTELGSEALRSATAEMPRLVRQLLLLINGMSPASSYAQALKAYGDIYTTLTELEAAGYISRVEDEIQPSASDSKRKRSKGADSTFANTRSSWSTIFNTRQSKSTRPGGDETTFESTVRDGDPTEFEPTRGLADDRQSQDEQSPISGFDDFDIKKSLAQKSQVALELAAASSLQAPEPVQLSRLEQVVAEMSNFMLDYIGPDAQEMVNLIAEFRTEEELYAFLPRYEAGLVRRGIDANAHFDRIEWILQS